MTTFDDEFIQQQRELAEKAKAEGFYSVPSVEWQAQAVNNYFFALAEIERLRGELEQVRAKGEGYIRFLEWCYANRQLDEPSDVARLFDLYEEQWREANPTHECGFTGNEPPNAFD